MARFSAPPTQRPAVVEVAAQTAEGPSDSEVLREVVRAACLRLGADWSSWLRAATGRCLVVPAWRGLYLTLPRVAAAAPDGGAAEEAVRGAPAPPGSDFWDWPLSRREKWERAVFVDRQMLLADQRALMEHAEVLRSDCIQNGIEVSPYLWDSF
uniref:Uncharacterized protein n=1 Tax=Pyrodinium bahamense TaxID=73915 RepID=A0A7S0FWB6_9DINO